VQPCPPPDCTGNFAPSQDVRIVAVASAAAHLVRAYQELELLTAPSSPYARSVPMEDAIRLVCGALVCLGGTA
jgi:hypothetical protein